MFRYGRQQRSDPRPAAALFGAVDEVGIVVFFGALTADSLDVFTDELRGAPRPLRIDLALVDHIDAAGVDALLELHDLESDATGVGIDLTAMSHAVERVLGESGFAHYLTTQQHRTTDDLASDG